MLSKERKMDNINIERRGLLLALSSPSGSGKTTLTRKLLEVEDDIYLSVSLTTRPPRPGEVEGKDYFFTTEDAFQEYKQSNKLIESAFVYNHYYGTPRAFVDKHLKKGHDVLFDIDWQGVQQLKAVMREDLVTVFILPPSLDELENRLKKRAQDTSEVIENRMKKASIETSHWAEYDYVIVNHELNACLQSLRSILTAARLQRTRQVGLFDFAKTLTFEGV